MATTEPVATFSRRSACLAEQSVQNPSAEPLNGLVGEASQAFPTEKAGGRQQTDADEFLCIAANARPLQRWDSL
jgi:hypothetical protein